MSETEVNLCGEFDSVVWTREWLKILPDIDPSDEGTMIGWFANAIMSGHDEGWRRCEKEKDREVARLRADIDRIRRIADTALNTEPQEASSDEAVLVRIALRIAALEAENERLRAVVEAAELVTLGFESDADGITSIGPTVDMDALRDALAKEASSDE